MLRRAAQALQVFLAAGMDKIAIPDPDAQMSQYLIWLEADGNGVNPASRPLPRPGLPVAQLAPGGAPSAAGPAVPPPVLVPRRKKLTDSKDFPKKKHRKKRHREVPVGAPVAPPPGMDFDVELVPVKSSKKADKSKKIVLPVAKGVGLLTRRQLLLAALGGAALVGAIAVGGVLASGGLGPFLKKLGLPPDQGPEQPENP